MSDSYKIHPLAYKSPNSHTRGPKTDKILYGINSAERRRRDKEVEELYQLLLRDNMFFMVNIKHNHAPVGDKELTSAWEWLPEDGNERRRIVIEIRRVRKCLAFNVNGTAYRHLSFLFMKKFIHMWNSDVPFKITPEIEKFEKDGFYIQNPSAFKYLSYDNEEHKVRLLGSRAEIDKEELDRVIEHR